MSTFLIRSTTSQASSYPIVLTRLSGPRSRPNPHLKFVEVPVILLVIVVVCCTDPSVSSALPTLTPPFIIITPAFCQSESP